MNEVPVQARLRPRTSPLLKVLACLLATGAGIGASAAVAAPLYQIEVIVFQPLQSTPKVEGGQPVPPALVNGDVATIDTVTLPAEDLLLNDAVKRLNGSGRYRTLLHYGWRQNALQAQAVRIGDREGATETGVGGYAAVQIGQQLALNIALACNRDGAGSVLRARRTVRVGELHYIDDPLCGALVQVTRVRATVE
jgi:hypothetical protein